MRSVRCGRCLKGAPFFVEFRKRYLFIAGFILFISVLYFSRSGFGILRLSVMKG